LAFIRVAMLTPWRLAISERVSPSCTTIRPPLATLRPPLLVRLLLPPPDPPGIRSRLPASTMSGLRMPLSSIRRLMLIPWRSAISERLSPSRTTT